MTWLYIPSDRVRTPWRSESASCMNTMPTIEISIISMTPMIG